MVLNYLPLGYQWKGCEKTLERSLHGLVEFRVKRRVLWLHILSFSTTLKQVVVSTSVIWVGLCMTVSLNS